MDVYVYVYIYTYSYLSIHMHIFKNTYVLTVDSNDQGYKSMYTCVCIYVCICIYIISVYIHMCTF